MCAQNLTSSLRYHGEDKHRDEVRYLSSRLLSMLTPTSEQRRQLSSDDHGPTLLHLRADFCLAIFLSFRFRIGNVGTSTV